jgi:hypothetical protein
LRTTPAAPFEAQQPPAFGAGAATGFAFADEQAEPR